MKLIAYLRGGLGDYWPAVCVIKKVILDNNIARENVLVISDSSYYWQNMKAVLGNTLKAAVAKLTDNVHYVTPAEGKFFQRKVDDLNRQIFKVDFYALVRDREQAGDFMFWRPESLKQFVRSKLDADTIFIDSPYSGVIDRWENGHYTRLTDQHIFEWDPPDNERESIDRLVAGPHVLLHIRVKHAYKGESSDDGIWNPLVTFCNREGVAPIVLQHETVSDDYVPLTGVFRDLRGPDPFSFEGMGYLVSKANILVGTSSGLMGIKIYQRQMHKLAIFVAEIWPRKDDYVRDGSNCLLLDARQPNNAGTIANAIKDYYQRIA